MPIIQKGQTIIHTPPDKPVPEPGPETIGNEYSVYHDQLTNVELLLRWNSFGLPESIDNATMVIRVGTERLELSRDEYRGLYSGMLNIGPGKDNIVWGER